MAESNTTLKCNYPPIKNEFLKVVLKCIKILQCAFKIQAHLISLHFTLLCFTNVFHFLKTNSRFVVIPHWSHLLAPLLQHHLLLSCLCHTLVILTTFQIFSFLLCLCLSVIFDVPTVTGFVVTTNHVHKKQQT